MKTLKILLFAFAILMFSGCYTQLLVEDDDPWTTAEQPVYIPPPDPILIYYPSYPYPPPDPPRPPTPPIGGPVYPNPVGPGGTTDPHRDSGNKRRGSDQQNSQDNSRNGGATRSGDQNGSRQSTQTSSQVSVPTRGDSGTQSSPPQRSSQDNSTTGRRR
jgi:hypothetical protein